jgi:hypothetical protein
MRSGLVRREGCQEDGRRRGVEKEKEEELKLIRS